MPEIYNNSENNTSIELNRPQSVESLTPENYVENISNSETQIEHITPITEQYKAEQHIKQVVETQKNMYNNSTSVSPISPKLQEKYGWLLNIPEENRVEISVKLITTKGKDILDVIHAFLAIEDYISLDRLEENLNYIYPTLVEEGLLPDINDK
jgi:hypothetical protein